MAADEPVDIVAFEGGEIAPLGETIALTARSGRGDRILLRMDSELLERSVPLLIALAARARELADAGLPGAGAPGERAVALARRITGLAVHDGGEKLALEIRLSPQDLPVTFALPREVARQLADRLQRWLG